MPDTKDPIRRVSSLLPHMMLRDRENLSRQLTRLRRRPEELRARLGSLEKRAEASVLERKNRLARKPAVTFPADLPITAKAKEIVRLIQSHPVVIVSGETGCGKSTQIPKMCLEAGRGTAGKIGCTQPRRIAAITIAHRIAQELGEEVGRSVGYKIRFRDKTSPQGYIKIMTDGMLLAETQADRGLLEYDTLIIDEAHERTLNIDFILGILKTLLPERPELKVIITSATLDTEKFSAAFGDAPVVKVSGRLYPIEVKYLPLDPETEERGETTYIDMAVQTVDALRRDRQRGDILIFMPTEEDILETCERLRGRRDSETHVLPLFARLPASEQGRVYSVSGSKIVVATNVAETSLTIPGIRIVIDTGLARIPRYLPRTRTTSLGVGPVSQSSADQRKGRCGRVQNGLCIRLYSEKDYQSRPVFTPPEIQRSNLAEVILRMISLQLGAPSTFPFLDAPADRSVKDGFDLLHELGAVLREGQDYRLTEKGRVMARIPLDPRISRMVLEAAQEGCLEETAVIASALSIQDPRERPVEKAPQADRMHAPFKDPDSDFLTLLNIWKRYHREWEALKTQNQMRKFCRTHFLAYSRMREWVYTHDQITAVLREQRISEREAQKGMRYDAVHRSVLSGFLSNIAVKKEKNTYSAARGREVMLHPGSTLFNRAPAWIVAAEFVKTSRLFARTAAKIHPEWLEAVGGALCRSRYSDPWWDAERGEVRAHEQVSLFGLVIVPRRPVSYGRINPEASHAIFVESALVEGKTKNPLPFLVHNQQVLARLETMEDKLRRRDILVSEEAIADFYSERLEGVRDEPGLKKRIREKGGDAFLRLSEQDLLLRHPAEGELVQYPDVIRAGEREFCCEYAFAPGREEDGVTLKVPSGLVSTIPAESLDWGVPGLMREKVTALIKGLPKRYRRQLVPVSRTVDEAMRHMERGDRSLVDTLSAFVYRHFGVDIPAPVWAEVEVPAHLNVRVSVVDHTGKELESGRDIQRLTRSDKGRSAPENSEPWERGRKEWERKGIGSWDFGELPESLPLGEHLVAYPGLEADEAGVNLVLFRNREEAMTSHCNGVRRLLARHLAKELKYLKRNLALPRDAAAAATRFGGAAALEEAMIEHLLARFLERNIRSAGEMDQACRELRLVLVQEGAVLKDQVLRILDAHDEVWKMLQSVGGARSADPGLSQEILRELDALVPVDFLLNYGADRLEQIPRYLKALQIRAERGFNDPWKHRSKTARVEEFTRVYQRLMEGLSPHAGTAKRKALDEFRWMIEEFKVSLFAQELKTTFPVSQKRLEQKIREIERMV